MTPARKKSEPVFDAEIVEATWDKKKIAAGLLVAVLLGAGWVGGSKYLAMQAAPKHLLSVQGATAVADTPTLVPTSAVRISLPNQQDVNNQLQNIQEQVQKVNVQEIATTSPQIQSIIQEIQSLPSLPGKAAKTTCEQICNSL